MMSADDSWYACREHLEWVIDDFVDQYQQAPDIETYGNEVQIAPRCRQCGGKPAYRLLHCNGE